MLFVFTVLTIAPAFMAFILKGKTGWRILAILALIIMLLNGVHSLLHLVQGDILNGKYDLYRSNGSRHCCGYLVF